MACTCDVPVYTRLAVNSIPLHCLVSIPKFGEVILEREAMAHVLVIVFEKGIVESFEFVVCVFLNDSDFELPNVCLSQFEQFVASVLGVCMVQAFLSKYHVIFEN